MNIEQAQEVHSSQLWTFVCEEIDNRIATEIIRLRMCGPEQLVKIQTRIETLEDIKRLPKDVIDRES